MAHPPVHSDLCTIQKRKLGHQKTLVAALDRQGELVWNLKILGMSGLLAMELAEFQSISFAFSSLGANPFPEPTRPTNELLLALHPSRALQAWTSGSRSLAPSCLPCKLGR